MVYVLAYKVYTCSRWS